MVENKEKYMYGLRDKVSKKLVGYYTRSNEGGDCCVDTQYILGFDNENIWMVSDKLTASYVRVNSHPWYNASYESPTNNIDPETLEVVKIETIVTTEVPDEIPNFEEYMKLRYKNPHSPSYDPRHYKYHIEQYRRGVKYAPLSIYEIIQYKKLKETLKRFVPNTTEEE